jgi:hypothetical protein
MISGLSGETGRASPSGSGALGDEALCLPLLVDAREGPWEPADKIQVTEARMEGKEASRDNNAAEYKSCRVTLTSSQLPSLRQKLL